MKREQVFRLGAPMREGGLKWHTAPKQAAHPAGRRLILPRGLGHQVVQRLPGSLHALRMQPGSRRLDALAPAGQQRFLAVVLERLMPAGVPGGFGQALQTGRQALVLRVWPEAGGWHKTSVPANVPLAAQSY